MIAKITIYDGDKEILTTEQKVREVPMLSDEGLRYTDCYVRLYFSIIDDDDVKFNQTLYDKVQEKLVEVIGVEKPVKLPKCLEKGDAYED